MIELTPERRLRNELAYFLSQIPSPCTPRVIGELVTDWLAEHGVATLAGASLSIAERAKKPQSRLVLADEVWTSFGTTWMPFKWRRKDHPDPDALRP